MSSGTKNLGQVAGVHIATTPPTNTVLIWFDSTPNQMIHKTFDISLNQWVVLNKNIISSITRSELANISSTVGLSPGAWFKITDNNIDALALAITSDKVQYTDALGNILIDDLVTNIQYHVTSSNLFIDDVNGVFDVVNKKLVFQFNEQVPDYTADDFILGKVKRNNVWSLAKYKISRFLSTVTGNSITWNGGFFFNFNSAINNIKDTNNGIVSKQVHDADIQILNTAINNVATQNQSIISNANNLIVSETTNVKIYNKENPNPIDINGEPIDLASGDRLHASLSKIQRWINKFKFAKGIRVSQNFIDADSEQFINNDDTVESALSKIQYWKKNMRLPSNFVPKDYTSTIGDISASELYDEAFSIIQGKLGQIGNISNGHIASKEKTIDPELIVSKSIIDLKNGAITLYNKSSAKKRYIKIDSEEGSIKIKHNILPIDGRGSEISGAGVYSKASGMTNDKTTLEGINNFNSSALYHGIGSFTGVNTSDENLLAGVVGKAENLEPSSPSPAYGGYFEKIKISGLYLKTVIFDNNYPDNFYNVQDKDSLIVIKKLSFSSIILPKNPYIGQTIRIIRTIPGTMYILINASPNVTDKILQTDGNQTNSQTLNPHSVAVLYYIGGLWVIDK